MRSTVYVLIFLTTIAVAEAQTKAKPGSNAEPHIEKEADPVRGFALAPMVLTDEGCTRDYVRAFQFEGVELRKRITDLETYHCIDSTATGIFAGRLAGT
jgi:hypothetical protein